MAETLTPECRPCTPDGTPVPWGGKAPSAQQTPALQALDEVLECQHEDTIEALGEAPGITEQCKDCGAFRRTKVYGASHPDDGKWTHPPLIRLLLSTMGGPSATPGALPATPWRKVTGEEPPQGSQVLAIWDGDPRTAASAVRLGDWCDWRDWYGRRRGTPTHWMPLPPVPADHFPDVKEMVPK